MSIRNVPCIYVPEVVSIVPVALRPLIVPVHVAPRVSKKLMFLPS